MAKEYTFRIYKIVDGNGNFHFQAKERGLFWWSWVKINKYERGVFWSVKVQNSEREHLEKTLRKICFDRNACVEKVIFIDEIKIGGEK